MELIRIKIRELDDFCRSNLFQKLETKPVSPLRLKSYIANPRAEENDTVLYLFVENETLIAFRAVLPDLAYNEDGTSFRFAWCSGVWIDPKHRGKKLWQPLLEEAMKDWDNRLLLTNYAPITEALYTKENLFEPLLSRQGHRFYFKPDFKKIFRNRISNPVFRPFLGLASTIARVAYNIKSKFSVSVPDIRMEELDRPDRECIDLMQLVSKSTLFRRGEKELNWILDYPWITEKPDSSCRYPFSYDNIECKIKVVKHYFQNMFAGFFIYSIINREMKVLYHFENKNLELSAVAPILQIAKANEISHLTILSSLLSNKIRRKTNYFLFSKPYCSNIYSSFNFSCHDFLVFDGDGDNCFT